MFYLFFLLFVCLCIGLFISVFKSGKFKTWVKIARIAIVTFGAALFTYYFITKSVLQFRPDALTVQVINTLPLPLDFYLVKINSDQDPDGKYETRHIGTIRTNFYRIDHLNMNSSDEFWIAGFMGRKNLVYFSQHFIPNKNQDQIIEVHNYINQSAKLSEIANGLIADLKLENMKTAIWITLDLLLLFLNTTLLLKRAKK